MVLVGIISIMYPCTLRNCVSEVMSWVHVGPVLGHSTPGKVPGKHRLELKLMEFCHCLSWSRVSNSGVKEALPPPTTSSYAARTGCALSLSHAYHKYSNAELVTRKLNYCNTLLAELRARLLSAACCSLRAWQHVCSALWASRNALHHAAFFTLPASEVADWF